MYVFFSVRFIVVTRLSPVSLIILHVKFLGFFFFGFFSKMGVLI
jgi:hypothetical protein